MRAWQLGLSARFPSRVGSGKPNQVLHPMRKTTRTGELFDKLTVSKLTASLSAADASLLP